METYEESSTTVTRQKGYSIPQTKSEQELTSSISSQSKKVITPARFWRWFFEKDFEYESFENFAEGNFGEIKKAKFMFSNLNIYSNQVVALKYPLHKPNYSQEKEYHNLSHEISCTLILHPNIVNYIGGMYIPYLAIIVIIMEFVPSNLREAIQRDNRTREIMNQLKIAKQICLGMNFLHSLNPCILHRDLRSPNILINDNLECKIADFGIANNLGYKEMENKNLYTSLIPPECKEKGKFTKNSDVYFFGWVLFELLVGTQYVSEYQPNSIIRILNEEELHPKKKGFKLLINQSIQTVPNKRPSFHELLLSFNNLLESAIDYSILGQMNEGTLSYIVNKYKLTKSNLMEYSDSLGRKLVHEYCIYNNLEGLKALIAIIGEESLNLVDKYNCTCAHFASRNGNIEILKFLSAHGFNKWNEKEKRFNLFSLTISTAMKHDECVKFLLSYANIESLNEALISSSQEGNLEYSKLFLEKGADINFRDNELGSSSLFYASRNGHFDLVKFLVNHGADVNQRRTYDGNLPFYIACENGHLEIVEFLINNGANLNQGRIDNDCIPLYIASQNGHLRIVRFLIDHGASVNQPRGIDKCVPLYIASQKGDLEMVKLLVKSGANINQSNLNGITSLYIASQNGHSEIVKELINNGANLNQVTTNGYTALFTALMNNKQEVVSILKSISDIQFNIELAKKNKNFYALKLFQSLLQN